MPASGRELKYALTKALQTSAKEVLIDCAGQDLPDDMLAIEDFDFEIQDLANNEFVIRAKQLHTETRRPLDRPAHHFVVSITGGG